MKIVLLLFTLLLLHLPATAQVGITAVPFLQIEPDSRASGMGVTGVAVADDASAVFWNPAGLAFQTKSQIGTTYANWLPGFNTDLFYNYVVGTYHLKRVGTIAGHLTFLNLGQQVRMSDENIELGRFNSYQLAGGLSYGYKISENFSIGTGVRFIRGSLAGGEVEGAEINSGSSYGVDLGGMYKHTPFLLGERTTRINLGFNISNIGPRINYTDSNRREALPTTLRVGWSFKYDIDPQGRSNIRVTNDVTKLMARNEKINTGEGEIIYLPMSSLKALTGSWGTYHNTSNNIPVSLINQLMVGTGLEFNYNNQFFLRGGYYYEHENNGNRQFSTLGTGLRYGIYGIDFSYIYTLEEEHPLANTIKITLLISFK